ncbi:Copper transport outer membrane protein, MctB [Pedococcus dokdonensis]|uniref:Copper transport outer membrane protein, MctB n=1 Tax=Pedococcus dokdonensis TaxID=443156 RepID=A0A1H0PN61_9MICO|nr:copper transporter [Pedococcus dokdonensis]SDP06547.1 Copper transport outer membrane protein, MctB [Pedococcus dokdonensis]
MIDFRYHLVSIVSIFMALAVGIVLGAGPLKEDIGNTLTSEVKNLRADKAALRGELDAAEKGATARDEFTSASNRSLLAERLKDTTVTLVVLPGADPNLVKTTQGTLTTAGAVVGSTVSVQDNWIDPDKAAFRATLGQQLASQVGVPIDQSGGDVVNAVLARSVLAKAGSTSSGAASALEAMRTGDLIRYTPDDVKVASIAVVIAGPVNGSDAAAREDRATGLSNLAGAIDSAGAGAVLIAPSVSPGATNTTSVITVSRDDGDQSKVLSTVDDAELPMGQASLVFGLLEQEAGRSGQYGLASDASAAFPQLATK